MVDLFRKPYPIIRIAAVIIIAVSLFGFVNCNNLALSNEPETVELLQGVFTEVGFYYYDEEAELYTVYDANKKEIGYSFYAEGWGHGGPMIFLVGLKDRETIEGVIVIKHREASGGMGEQPGPRLVFDPLLEQFVGLKIEDCYLKDDFGLIDGITGASVSSRKTVDIIRETALTKFGLIESKIEWQSMSVLLVVIPITLIPVVFIWYSIIKRARAKEPVQK